MATAMDIVIATLQVLVEGLFRVANFPNVARTRMRWNATLLDDHCPFVLTWIRIRDIRQDHSDYQREVRPSKVIRIMRAIFVAGVFDIKPFMQIVVAQRRDGSLWCVDGQHRLTILEKLGIEFCAVQLFNSSGERYEARLWDRLNTRYAPSDVQRFHSALLGGSEWAVALNAAVTAAGFTLSPKDRTGHSDVDPLEIFAIGAARVAFETLGHNDFVRAFESLPRIFAPGFHRAITAGRFIWGWQLFYAEHAAKWRKKLPRLRRIFRRVDPAFILETAKTYRRFVHCKTGEILVSNDKDMGDRVRKTLNACLASKKAVATLDIEQLGRMVAEIEQGEL